MNEYLKSKPLQRARSSEAEKMTRPPAKRAKPHYPGSRGRKQDNCIQSRRFEDAWRTIQFQPARGLLICLGWLRLYQRIVSPILSPRYAVIARKGGRHER
jgi:hypothetical protein